MNIQTRFTQHLSKLSQKMNDKFMELKKAVTLSLSKCNTVFGHPTSVTRLRTSSKHRAIALFFTLTFLNTLVPYNQIWANNNGPNAPEAAAFEPVDATDMVNLSTGDLSYVLPLLNVPSPEGGYPLALSYHAGIAMDQEASWVGLGWNINVGTINRQTRNLPDDFGGGTEDKITIKTDMKPNWTVGVGGGTGFELFGLPTDFLQAGISPAFLL